MTKESTSDEDAALDEFILKREADEEIKWQKDKDYIEFDHLSTDSKLEKLQTLVKQSQVFSNIMAETLLENSLSKKKQEPEAVEAPPRKKSKTKGTRANGQASISDFYTKKTNSEANKAAKEKLQQNTISTFKQPALITGTSMRDYQLEGTEWLVTLYENGLNGILADEMGLGKTIQSIALLAFLYEQGIKGPFLIAAPLSTVGNWVREFQKFAPDLPVLGYVGTKDHRNQLRRKNFSKKSDGTLQVCTIITSYEIILRDFSDLSKINWKFLIVDEGHRLKNINCKLIRELKQLKTSNRLLLTGTPLQNNLDELWSLLNFILPDIFHDIELFQRWFDFSSLSSLSESVKDDETKKLIDSKIQETLINNLHTILKPFLLRRLKKTVVKNLPPKREYIIYGVLTEKQSQFYKNALHKTLKNHTLEFALEEFVDIYDSKIPRNEVHKFLKTKLSSSNVPAETNDDIGVTVGGRLLRSEDHNDFKTRTLNKYEKDLEKAWDNITKWVDAKHMQNLMMQLRLICDSPYLFYFPWESENDINLKKLVESSSKLQMLDQLVPRLVNKGHKVLVFSQFTKMLDLIQDWCGLVSYKSSRIDGSMSQEERETQIANFQDNDDVKLFLLSTRAGGLGLNLTSADSVIIFDSDWNPQADLQAMDRVHRIGQDKPVIVYRFAIVNTVEQIILAKADSKRRLEKVVIQMGKFGSIERLIKKDSTFTFSSKKKPQEESALVKELDAFLENSKFKVSEEIEDSKLTDTEMKELLDRSPQAYSRSLEEFQKNDFQHIQMFETTSSLN